MKTYQFSKPFDRISGNDTIHYEKVMFNRHWMIFDPGKIKDHILFSSDGTYRKTASKTESVGHWKYLGGDAFELQNNGSTYGLHLVHLDNNLMIFELHDTKQYFILVSQQCLRSINLNSLASIEYYIQKVQVEVQERMAHPTHYQSVVSHVIPIMVMGGICNSLFWNHDRDDDKHDSTDKEGHAYATDNADDFDPNDDFDDEENFDDQYDFENEDGFEDEDDFEDDELNAENDDNESTEYYEPVYDEPEYDEPYDEPVYEDESSDYGGFTEEEIIYDYL